MNNKLLFSKNKTIINLIITKFFAIVLVFLNIKLINFQFKEEGYGVYVILISILQFFTVFGNISYPVYFLKKIAPLVRLNNEIIEKEYKIGLNISIIFSTITFCLLQIFSNNISIFYELGDNGSLFIKFISILIPFTSIKELNAQLLRAFGKSNSFQILTSVLTQALLFSILLINFHNIFNLLAIIKILVAIEFFVFLVSFFLVSKLKLKLKLKFDFKDFRKISVSLPFFLGKIISVLFNFLTIILLSKFASKKDIGGYNIIMKYIALTTILIELANIYVAPKASKLFVNKEIRKLNLFLKKNNYMIVGFNIPVIMFFFTFPKFALNLFGSYDYMASSFIIILLGYTINMLCGSIGLVLQMVGYEIFYKNILFLSLLLYSITGYFLASIFDFQGIMIGRTLSLSLWNIVGVVFIYNKEKIKTFFHV